MALHASTRRIVLRLTLIASLLALYPLSILGLKLFVPSTTGSPLAADLALEVVPGDFPCAALAALTIKNRDDHEVTVRRVTLLVLDGETAILSRIEEGPAVAARMGGDAVLSPGQKFIMDPLCLEIPDAVEARAYLATVELWDPVSSRTVTVQSLLEGALGATPAEDAANDQAPPFPLPSASSSAPTSAP